MWIVNMAGMVTILMLIGMLPCIYSVGPCSSDTLPVVRMCMGGAALGPSVLMDFHDADIQMLPRCQCSVIINSGSMLSFNEQSAPGGLKCGTSITIKDNSDDIRHIINCYGETTVKYLQQGHVVKVILSRHFDDADADYCYRLDMGGGPFPSIHVQCDLHTTSTSTTTPTTIIETTGHNNASLMLNQDPVTKEVSQCTDITVMVLASLLVIAVIYGITITVYIFRRKRNKPDKVHNDRDDVYEEIRPTYNPATSGTNHVMMNRPLPNPALYQGSQLDFNPTKPNKAPIPPKWNNTYDRVEDHIGGMVYVNQRF